MFSPSNAGVSGNLRYLLRAEGLALFAAALALYSRTDASWTLFLVLFLAPDLAFLFYLAGARAGAVAYNVTHSTLGPIFLALLSQLDPVKESAPALLSFALIWFAHVGFDRMLGYGLKYASSFNDTHLGMIGKKRHQFA